LVKQRRIPVDMVVLSAGLEARHDSKQVAQSSAFPAARMTGSSNGIPS